jgi:hypothetical protein
MTPNCTLWRLATAALIALVASIAVAACGGSGPSGSSAASTTDSGLKYAACIRADGVPDYPDPRSGGGESIDRSPDKITIDGRTLAESPQVVQTAMSKCEKYSPITQGPPTSGGQLVKLRAQALAMATCMRAHGVPNYPDPTVTAGPGGHGVVMSLPGGIHAKAPAIDAAQKKCSW